MKISASFNKFDGDNGLKGFATLFLASEDDTMKIAINDLTLREGANGLWVAFPSKKTKDGYKNVSNPMNKETYTKISDLIVNLYNKSLEADGITNPEDVANEDVKPKPEPTSEDNMPF